MQSEPTVRLMAVVVVYCRNLDEVAGWPALRQSLRQSADGAAPLLDRILIYDNSPLPTAVPQGVPANCHYIHDARNGGTVAAYGSAAVMAGEYGCEWLLLLDQDTQLPPDFLGIAHAQLRATGRDPTLAAWVPWIHHGARAVPVSPARLTSLGSVRPLRREGLQTALPTLTAISSGAIVRADVLRGLLPFPKGLWLAYVDHWIFFRLSRSGLRVRVLECHLQHDLSVASPGKLSARRLLSILEGEALFHRMLGSGARLVYPIRLIWRLLRLTTVNPVLALHGLRWAVLWRGSPR